MARVCWPLFQTPVKLLGNRSSSIHACLSGLVLPCLKILSDLTSGSTLQEDNNSSHAPSLYFFIAFWPITKSIFLYVPRGPGKMSDSVRAVHRFQTKQTVRSFNFILSACFGLTKKVKKVRSNSAPNAVWYWSSHSTSSASPSLHLWGLGAGSFLLTLSVLLSS